MKDIVLSIHPKWAKLIYEGKKTIEWRKTYPKLAHRCCRVYLYETAPVKAVTGYFLFGETFVMNTFFSERYPGVVEKGFVPIEDLWKYQGDSASIRGWFVMQPKHFEIPRSIWSVTGLRRPPQSWQYVEAKNG